MKYRDYIEKKPRGTHDFPLEYYFVDKNYQHYVMPLHWHKEFEIIMVKKGRFAVYLENIEYILNEGDVLLVAPGTLHRGEPERAVYECVVFDLQMLIKNNNDTLIKQLIPFIKLNAKIDMPYFKTGGELSLETRALFETLREKKQFYEFQVLSKLFNIFYILFSLKKAVTVMEILHTGQAKAIADLIEWIEDNINEDITLKTLSQKSGFSEKYICKIFKQYTSKTVMTYINELRLEKSSYDMRVLGKNVTNAAFDNGFNDLSYFCKSFKKYFGITPNEYRKKI